MDNRGFSSRHCRSALSAFFRVAGAFVVLSGASLAACASDSGPSAPATKRDAGPTQGDATAELDAAVPDAASDAAIDKAAACASEFGTALTKGFGRFDGTVVAIVQPKDQQCALPNSDHVILQVLGNGAVYRMVINIQSDFGEDPRVRYTQIDHALVGGPWADGWHVPAQLDYVGDLGVHKNANGFSPFTLEELSLKIAADIDIGDRVSVFADTSGGASAHKIHRNLGGNDGAIVLRADSANPKYLLFHFDTQNF